METMRLFMAVLPFVEAELTLLGSLLTFLKTMLTCVEGQCQRGWGR